VKVYLFVLDLGDGSTGIDFVAEDDMEIFEQQYGESDNYRDGDGFGPKHTLVFDSREMAVLAGIDLYDPLDYEED
jgi:hypothetical protein